MMLMPHQHPQFLHAPQNLANEDLIFRDPQLNIPRGRPSPSTRRDLSAFEHMEMSLQEPLNPRQHNNIPNDIGDNSRTCTH